MNLLVDLDGCVIDIGYPWLERINRDFGCAVRWDEVSDWDLRKFVPEAARSSVYGYLHDVDLYDEAPAIPGALEALEKIRAMGVDVTFPSAGTDAQTAGKVAWLRRHGLLGSVEDDPLAADFCRIHKKHLLSGDLFIDDYPGNLEKMTVPSVLFPAPYNAHLQNGPWRRPDSVVTAWRTLTNWVEQLQLGALSPEFFRPREARDMSTQAPGPGRG